MAIPEGEPGYGDPTDPGGPGEPGQNTPDPQSPVDVMWAGESISQKYNQTRLLTPADFNGQGPETAAYIDWANKKFIASLQVQQAETGVSGTGKPGQASIGGFMSQLQNLSSQGTQQQRLASALARSSEEGRSRQAIADATRRGLGGSGAQLAGMRSAQVETDRARLESEIETRKAITEEVVAITDTATKLMAAEMEYYKLGLEEMAQHINTLSLWMDLLTNNDLISSSDNAKVVGNAIGGVLDECLALGTQDERTACISRSFGTVGQQLAASKKGK